MAGARRTWREKLLQSLLVYEYGAICPAEMWRGVVEGLAGRDYRKRWESLGGAIHKRLKFIRADRPLSFNAVMKECPGPLAGFLQKATASAS